MIAAIVFGLYFTFYSGGDQVINEISVSKCKILIKLDQFQFLAASLKDLKAQNFNDSFVCLSRLFKEERFAISAIRTTLHSPKEAESFIQAELNAIDELENRVVAAIKLLPS